MTKRFLFHVVPWLWAAVFSAGFTGCGNCTGPDEDGEYICEESDGPESGEEGNWTWDDDEEEEDANWTFLSFFFPDKEEREYNRRSSCTPIPELYDCNPKDSVRAIIRAKLKRPSHVTLVGVKYYSGNYEDGNLIEPGSNNSDYIDAKAPSGLISATALYVDGKDTIMAVDGAKLKTRAVHYCEKTCFEAEPVTLDLSLCRDARK